MEELIIKLFSENLEINQIYKTSFLNQLFIDNNINFNNVMTLSYNIWNRGMSKPFPLMDNISHGEYKYVGINYNLNGDIINVPRNERNGRIEGNLEYKIGEWINGDYKLDNYIDFNDWKKKSKDDEGKKLILLGTDFELRIGGIIKGYKLSNNIGDNLLPIETNLGRIVHRKYVGFIFKRPNYNDECEILTIL